MGGVQQGYVVNNGDCDDNVFIALSYIEVEVHYNFLHIFFADYNKISHILITSYTFYTHKNSPKTTISVSIDLIAMWNNRIKAVLHIHLHFVWYDQNNDITSLSRIKEIIYCTVHTQYH